MRALLATMIFCLALCTQNAPAEASWIIGEPGTPPTPVKALIKTPVRVLRDITAIYERVTQAALAAGVPLPIAHAVVRMESGYNPHARSSAGAIGVMQVLPRTARAMGENAYDVDGNLRAGMKYLRLALASSSDLCAAISAYEHGIYVRRPFCTAYGRKVLAMAR